MNPPSALNSAMSRDRKPFTYTPGGLDLSEIKSERMAKRLMRNAMNQGLPERPPQLQSPPTPSTPIAVPNFNCLPVQVFPTINLPANPKSLLRTRSIPGQPREPSLERGPPPQFVNNQKPPPPQPNNVFYKNTPTYPGINNGRPASMYEQGSNYSLPMMNYGSGGHTLPFANLNFEQTYKPVQPSVNIYTPNVLPDIKPEYNYNNNYTLPKLNDTIPTYDVVAPVSVVAPVTVFDTEDSKINIEAEINISSSENNTTKPVEEDPSLEQKEVKVVKTQVKQETSVKETNGTQNGDAETEAVIKLPSKKSAAKTETKVEVSTKTLPDGSVEEVKKTITRTTIDGKTEIKTKTETRIIPKDEPEEEEEVVEEDEENGEAQIEEQDAEEPETTVVTLQAAVKQNGEQNIIKTEESSETTTTSTKKIIVVQDDKEEEAEEEEEEVVEEEVDAEPVTFVIKKAAEKPPTPQEIVEEDKTEDVEVEVTAEKAEEIEEAEEEVVEETLEQKNIEEEQEIEEEIEEEEQYEQAEEKVEAEPEVKEVKEEIKEEEEIVQEAAVIEIKPEESEVTTETKPSEEIVNETSEPTEEEIKTEIGEQQISEEKQEIVINKEELKSEKQEVKEVILTPKIEQSDEPKSFMREPSVPLEKVEDVEIKPISAGDFLTKSHTQSTEIITNAADRPSGIVTEYNRKETIETVKRTIETLDPNPPIPSFFPHVEKISPTAQIQRPYQPVYPPEPVTERRHSLLLERLSMERQLPTSEIYHNTSNTSSFVNQTNEQQQWGQEPRVEILEVNNVKPSSITNQQWYQQTKKDVPYSAPTPQPTTPGWTQPQSQTTQPMFSPQPQYQSQPSPQPQYQSQPSPQPQFQHQLSPQPQYQRQPSPQPQYQPSYIDNTQQNISSTQQTTYNSYNSKPTTWTASTNLESSTQSNQYNSSSYQSTQQQMSSSYVPPPWEQDSTYVLETPQNFYQPPPQTNTYSPAPNEGWKPTLPTSKFTKPPPKAYIPPKPNQSFVKPLTNEEPPKVSGRKTYYSEYERRYISVPESTYIPPAASKLQVQPDPSPQYYYDNNEPAEPVEHQWRKELREFTEKTQTQTQTQTQIQTETNINPPWEPAAKTPEVSYTPAPTWSQTVRPQSWRERSFESDFVSQEWPKTNTLGRGRPLSSYGKENIPEIRTRGVSVDRYNPNSYQSPAEHPPVQTYTHNPPAPHATGYHNPNVPAYHARASAEPREQSSPYQQPRAWRQNQASPFQSRSFKYLQWITGTDD